jgi:hypothetical protein
VGTSLDVSAEGNSVVIPGAKRAPGIHNPWNAGDVRTLYLKAQ